MTTAVVVFAVWAACGAASYYLVRGLCMRDFDWTRGDHRVTLVFASLGPIGLVAACVGALLIEIGRYLDRPDRKRFFDDPEVMRRRSR